MVIGNRDALNESLEALKAKLKLEAIQDLYKEQYRQVYIAQQNAITSAKEYKKIDEELQEIKKRRFA